MEVSGIGEDVETCADRVRAFLEGEQFVEETINIPAGSAKRLDQAMKAKYNRFWNNVAELEAGTSTVSLSGTNAGVGKTKDLIADAIFVEKYSSMILSVPCDRVGIIVGKFGATVQRLQADHKCHIQVDRMTNNGAIYISFFGYPDCIRNAVDEVLELAGNPRNAFVCPGCYFRFDTPGMCNLHMRTGKGGQEGFACSMRCCPSSKCCWIGPESQMPVHVRVHRIGGAQEDAHFQYKPAGRPEKAGRAHQEKEGEKKQKEYTFSSDEEDNFNDKGAGGASGSSSGPRKSKSKRPSASSSASDGMPGPSRPSARPTQGTATASGLYGAKISTRDNNAIEAKAEPILADFFAELNPLKDKAERKKIWRKWQLKWHTD